MLSTNCRKGRSNFFNKEPCGLPVGSQPMDEHTFVPICIVNYDDAIMHTAGERTRL
uniref:Uncharacterized protein n=1 Tax=Parascaris univalens TaxID=6257 RepID=A0A915AAR8_PARUN